MIQGSNGKLGSGSAEKGRAAGANALHAVKWVSCAARQDMPVILADSQDKLQAFMRVTMTACLVTSCW